MSSDDNIAQIVNFAVELGMTDITAFIASIPDSKSAITIGGDEATVKFDIPRTAPLFGERMHNQRPAVMTLDLFQTEHRPIIVIAILMPSNQTEMDFGGEGEKQAEPKDPSPAAPEAESSDESGIDPEWPSTMQVVHNHLHLTVGEGNDLPQVLTAFDRRLIEAAGAGRENTE